ncbi:putative membrane-associated kinase regulator [Arachis hypogaea]|nr:putative membrane-associated kinase regulator [Arachis hypogaea]
MDSLNFLKFWRNNPSPMTTTTAQPHLVVETDIESDDDEEDSFFDLELTLHDMQTPKQTKHDTDDVPSISKRKETHQHNAKTEDNPPHSSGRLHSTSKVFALKLHVQDFHSCSSTPTLSRVNSTRSFGAKLGTEQPKTHRFSKESLQKYLKLIRPFYVRVSRNYGDTTASPTVASVSSGNARHSSFPAGMRGVSRHLGKSRSSPAALVGVGSLASRSDDTLLLQHDGIQGAILHCKRSFNSRESSNADCVEERSVPWMRNSFEDKHAL